MAGRSAPGNSNRFVGVKLGQTRKVFEDLWDILLYQSLDHPKNFEDPKGLTKVLLRNLSGRRIGQIMILMSKDLIICLELYF